MLFADLRDWIAFLEKQEELVRVTREVRAEPDIGAMGRAICDTQGPGVLLEKVAGFATPVAVGLHGSWRRSNLAVGLPADATRKEQVERWVAALKAHETNPIRAEMVTGAPCKQNVVTGSQVNLFALPVPRLNKQDASFYLSKPLCITRDPDSGWVNVGMYRMMILNRNEAGILLMPFQDIGHHFAKYLGQGRSMPMAVALGTEPALPMLAGAKIPVGWSEYDVVSTLRGEPEELVWGETVDLPVPAHAEIVLEGQVRHDRRALEASFGEFTGAYSAYEMVPVFEVQAITYRDNPIYEALYIGKPYHEADYMTMCTKLAGLWHAIMPKHPQIKQIAFLPPYCLNTVVQGRWRHTGDPRVVMNALWGHGLVQKIITCVDEDVDPWDPAQVMWAIATRSQADKDLVIIPDCPPSLDPSQSLHGTLCRLGIDATKTRPPYHRSKPAAGWVEPPEGTEEWKHELANSSRRE